jgi:hypothetical protein
VQHIVPEDFTDESMETLYAGPQPFKFRGTKQQSHAQLGEISTTTTIGELPQDHLRGVCAHVTKSLDKVPDQKGNVSVVKQALRSAAIECMNQWAEQKRSGDVVRLYTMSLVRITRKQPRAFMDSNMTSYG